MSKAELLIEAPANNKSIGNMVEEELSAIERQYGVKIDEHKARPLVEKTKFDVAE